MSNIFLFFLDKVQYFSGMKKKIEKKVNNTSMESKEYTTNRNWSYIATELKQWSLNPENQIIEEYYTNLDIPHDTFYRHVASNKELKEAHQYALIRLGINREKVVNKHFLSLGTALAASLPDYLPRWQKNAEDRAKLKMQIAEAEKPAVINFYQKPIPEEDK